MLGFLMKFALVATTIAPIGLTLAFLVYKVQQDCLKALLIAAVSLVLCGICLEIIVASSKRLNRTTITVSSTKPAVKEISGYFVAYMLPILGGGSYFVDAATFSFFAATFFVFIWVSKASYANPILALCGYKFFEIQLSNGANLLLITRSKIHVPSEVTHVRYVTSHTVLDASKEQ